MWFWTRGLSKSVKAAVWWAVYICGMSNFFWKIYFCDISLKNTLVQVFCLQNETNQDHEISKVSCLIKQGSKMSNVCPKQGQKDFEGFGWTPLLKLPLSTFPSLALHLPMLILCILFFWWGLGVRQQTSCLMGSANKWQILSSFLKTPVNLFWWHSGNCLK